MTPDEICRECCKKTCPRECKILAAFEALRTENKGLWAREQVAAEIADKNHSRLALADALAEAVESNDWLKVLDACTAYRAE